MKNKSVRQRIHFKTFLTTDKSVKDVAPEYLCELVSIRKSTQKAGHPFTYYCRYPSIGSCHIVIVHLVFQLLNLWNSLPVDFRISSSVVKFKSVFKTHLFNDVSYSKLVYGSSTN